MLLNREWSVPWQVTSTVVTGAIMKAMLSSLSLSTCGVAYYQFCCDCILKANFLLKIKFCFLTQAVVIFLAKRLCLVS